MGSLRLPDGKRLAVALGIDFDAQAIWMGSFGWTSPAYMHRGEFGALVGAPRLLKLFEKHGVLTTWAIPGHTIDTFPDQAKAVQAAGHEIIHHGYWHENPTKLERSEEERLIALALETHQQVLNQRPRGYRSPYWDISENTLDLLAEAGFEFDSSLMGRDFTPYRPRKIEVNWETGNKYGAESPILELPVSWYLDDFPVLEYVTGFQTGQASTEDTLMRWRDMFDYAYEDPECTCYIHTVHPQVAGRVHHLLLYERLIEYMASHDGVWFVTLSEMSDAWVDHD
jgi:peptidoglycan/xylan/chitin deacetylase (PgdA/CDA1 family)